MRKTWLALALVQAACVVGGDQPSRIADPVAFRGATLTGGSYDTWLDITPVPYTAVGGVQTIELIAAEPTQLVPVIVGDAFAIDAFDGTRVRVRALAAGSATLRILDVSGQNRGELLLRADALAYATIGDGRFEESVCCRKDALLPSADVTASVLLHGMYAERVVDEDMTIAAPVDVVRRSWDSVGISTLATGSTTLAITAAGQHLSVPVPVVAATALEVLGGTLGMQVGDQGELCFAATRDAAAGEDSYWVHGLDWLFAPSSEIAIGPASNANCVTIYGMHAGAATLRAIAGGLELTAALEIH